MATRTTHHRRVAAGVFAGALLLVPLTGCGDSSDPSAADASPQVTETESSPAEDTSSPAETSGPEDTGSAGASGTAGGTEGDTNADVDCSGTSCSVSLTGNGAEAEILGTQVSLAALADGRATLQVGDREFSCSQGERVSAGPLTIECTTVSEDSVTMTASLG
ncbi:hypothetical protein [Geodermatophilus normandii]|uniref:Uncharacterized protein n=1 Tax=Geodermatophilus normandii TaxID=1137989 RepID=A0A6P0GLP2_9ACTN|nr:hypothetical protein [Geodermatophilus normandii]NEM08268.1 hypothetical protein [Geodermatophilus normandii]